MDYKDKLRLAKEALDSGSYDKETIEYIFPELKESEDERIRKEIIESIKGDMIMRSSKDKELAIAWLEKQKSITNEEFEQGKKDVLWCIEQAKKHSKGENEMGTCWFAEKWLEKQKSDDKVEPKFKVGDIIIKKHNSDINKFGRFPITHINEGKYWYDNYVICEISKQDEWELVEQKSADKVLVNEELYEHLRNTCACIDDAMSSETLVDIKDYLGQASADAQKAFDIIEKQKPAEWSEEDENILNGIIAYLSTHDSCELEVFDKWYDWLKSIKDRVQPKQEWNEDDETTINNLVWAIANDAIRPQDRDDYCDWLKSLRPQKQWKVVDKDYIYQRACFGSEKR